MTALALAGAVLCGMPVTASAVTTRTIEAHAALADQADATITFSDTGITSAQAGGFEVDGCNLTITEAGTYTLTGSWANSHGNSVCCRPRGQWGTKTQCWYARG